MSAISEYVISAASASASAGVLPSRAFPALLSAFPALLLFSKKRVRAEIGRGTPRVSPAGGEGCERERGGGRLRVSKETCYMSPPKKHLPYVNRDLLLRELRAAEEAGGYARSVFEEPEGP